MEEKNIDEEIRRNVKAINDKGFFNDLDATTMTAFEEVLRNTVHYSFMSQEFSSDTSNDDKWNIIAVPAKGRFENDEVQLKFNFKLHHYYQSLELTSLMVKLPNKNGAQMSINQVEHLPHAEIVYEQVKGRRTNERIRKFQLPNNKFGNRLR